MGIQINGQTDTISAVDGALTVSGADLPTVTNLNATGIVTATGFVGNVTGNLNSSGVSTFTNGPVLIGSGTSTGTASQRLQVTGGAYVSGSLGIGTNNPGAPLHVVSNSSAEGIRLAGRSSDNIGSLYFRNNADSATYGLIQGRSTELRISSESASQPITFYTDSEKARIDTSGRLLIGTNTSMSAGAQAQYAKFQIIGSTASATGQGIISIGRGQAASGGITANNDIGYINFTDNAGNEFAQIGCLTDAVAGSGDYPGRLVFSTTADGASSPTERLRISSTGQVYIGSSPNSDARLQVMVASPVSYNAGGYNGTNANIRLTTAGSPTTGNCTGISFGIGGSAEAYIGAVQVATTGYADLVFQGYGGSYSEKMRLTSTGRLLIGTSTDYTYGLLTVQGGNAGDAGNVNGLYVRGNGAAVSCPIYFNDEFGYPQKSIYQESYYLKIRGHNNEGVWILGSNASTNPSTNYKFNGTNNGSQCFNASNTTTWNTTSDVRIKENIQPLKMLLRR